MLGTASIYPLLPSSLLASPHSDEHFFIFVELKGGVNYAIATDCPDPQKLPDNQNIFMQLTLNNAGELGDTSKLQLTAKQQEFMIAVNRSSIPFAYHTDSYVLAFYGFSYAPELPPEEEQRLFNEVEKSIKEAEHIAKNGATLQKKREAIRKAKQTLLRAKDLTSG